MPLSLNPNCLARLQESLAEQLVFVTVQNGKYLTPTTSGHIFPSEAVLPKSGKIHDQMQRYVGEIPLVDFVSGTLARELHDSCDYLTEMGPTPLSEVPIFSDLSALALRLTTEFVSLPWPYTLTVALPQSFSDIFCEHIFKMQISESIFIRTGDDSLEESHSLVSGIERRDQSIRGLGLAAFLTPPNPKWQPDRAYLQVKVEGFVGKFTETQPLVDAINVVRTFYGLSLALRLLKPGHSYQASPHHEKVYIHRQMNGKWIIEDLQELEPRHSDVIRDLSLNDLDGTLDDPKKLASWMLQTLKLIGLVFKADERAKNVSLGALWLLDSYCGSDELLQFVQAAVVVEILLGEKASSDEIGLGKLLANRCAYLISKSHTERSDILQYFSKIYDVRSKIVHRGKSRFVIGEKVLFDTLRWMCRRIIQEEVALLQKDLEGQITSLP